MCVEPEPHPRYRPFLIREAEGVWSCVSRFFNRLGFAISPRAVRLVPILDVKGRNTFCRIPGQV